MSAPSERKYKQALLPFKMTVSSKKRKLEEDNITDDAKSRKTDSDETDSQNENPQQASDSINSRNDEVSTDVTTPNKNCLRRYLKPVILISENDKTDAVNDKPEVQKMDVDETAAENSCPGNVNDDEKQNSPESNETCTEQTQVLECSKKILEHNVDSADDSLNSSKCEDISISESDTSVNTTDPSVKNFAEKLGLSSKKLTPKQLQKKREAEQKKQERERLKQEKEQKKQLEKELKEKKRLAEIETKNEERRVKEEERKAKEEEKRVKEEERKAKEEEKRLKTLVKEEEKRQKDEEKRQKEEQEKKVKAKFTNYFLKNKPTQQKNTVEIDEKSQCCRFMPFEVKADMRLANTTRATLNTERRQLLDNVLKKNIEMEKNSLYLNQLHSKDYKPGHSENTWPLNEDDDDIVCLDDVPKSQKATKYRVKLLQFGENKRPAYWGTWRKRSKTITGRTPFKCDSVYFEYDVDSDDEWVDEEPGESLHGSDDEKESEDEYELDNEVFVPHGYLSDEEAQDDGIQDKSPKSQKLKLNILEKQFEAEMKEKTSKLRSRIFGCVYIPNSIKENEGRDDVENLLLSFRAVWNEERAPFCSKLEAEDVTPQSTPTVKAKIKTEFPDFLLADLIKLIHGNKNSSQKLSEEFKMHVLNKDKTLNLPKTCIISKMKEISSWVPNICCWVVNEDIKNQHNLTQLSHQENTWVYVSGINIPTKKSDKQSITEKPLSVSSQLSVTPTTSANQKSRTSSITKFVKVLTPDEKQKQLINVVPEKKVITPPPSNSILNYVIEETKKGTTSDCTPAFKKRAILFTLDKNDHKLLTVPQWNFGAKILNNEVRKSPVDTVVLSEDPLCSGNGSSTSTTSANDLKSVTVSKPNRAISRKKIIDKDIIIISDDDSNSEKLSCSRTVSTNNNLQEHINIVSKNSSDDESKSKIERDKSEIQKSNSVNKSEKANLASPKPNIREANGKKYAKLITIGKLSKE